MYVAGAAGAMPAAVRAAVPPPPPLPSLQYKVDTSRPSLRTNWTRLVHMRAAVPLRAPRPAPRAPRPPRAPPRARRAPRAPCAARGVRPTRARGRGQVAEVAGARAEAGRDGAPWVSPAGEVLRGEALLRALEAAGRLQLECW